MRGGGIGASLEAFPIPLGSTDILSNALLQGHLVGHLVNVPLLPPGPKLAQMKR